MKFVLIFVFVISIGYRANAQATPDTTMATYLKNRQYVLFTDSAGLPVTIQKYYTPVKKYLTTKFGTPQGAYVACAYIGDNDKILSFPIELLSGIQAIKKMDEEMARINAAAKDTIINSQKTKIQYINQMGGNASGRDGLLTFNKTTGKITFGMFQ